MLLLSGYLYTPGVHGTHSLMAGRKFVSETREMATKGVSDDEIKHIIRAIKNEDPSQIMQAANKSKL